MARLLLTLVVGSALAASAQEAQTTAVPTPSPVAKDAVPPPMLVQPTPLSARERMLSTWGFGFLGTGSVLKAQPDLSGLAQPVLRTTVPLLGVRWWTPWPRLGLELGVGAMVSGSYADMATQFGTPAGTGPASTEFLFHFSAPIVLGSTQHLIVFIAPEARAGFSRFQPDSSNLGVVTATTLDFSLKGGVEIFFSFIGLPNLSIEAGVRAGIVHELRSTAVSLPLRGDQVSTSSQTRFATTLIANPWDLFTSTLAARYYF